jgi:hypothetical protein
MTKSGLKIPQVSPQNPRGATNMAAKRNCWSHFSWAQNAVIATGGSADIENRRRVRLVSMATSHATSSDCVCQVS